MIIDAHLHLPCDDSLITLEDKKVRLLDDLFKESVNGAIVIADSELQSPIGTTGECVELFLNSKNIFVIGGISPLIEFNSGLLQLKEFLKQKLIVGCKLYPGHEAFFMNDDRLTEIFKLCIEYNVPLLVHTGWDNAQYNHPKYFTEIAKVYPALRLVICHLYWPNIDLCYSLTSKYQNIYYDISSLAYETSCLEKTRMSLNSIAQNDVNRIIFGTDYGMCSIKAHIDLIISLDIDDKKKKSILYNNAIDLYKIKLS